MKNYRDLVADDPGELFKAFAGAQLQRDAFLAGTDRPQRERLDVPTASEANEQYAVRRFPLHTLPRVRKSAWEAKPNGSESGNPSMVLTSMTERVSQRRTRQQE